MLTLDEMHPLANTLFKNRDLQCSDWDSKNGVLQCQEVMLFVLIPGDQAIGQTINRTTKIRKA